MAKAQEPRGFTWPMLVTAWLTPVLIGATVFLLTTLDRKDALKGRFAAVDAQLSQAGVQEKTLKEAFMAETSWIGFTPAGSPAILANGLTERPWTGTDENSPSYKSYQKAFTAKQELVTSLAGFQQHLANEYEAALRDNLAYLALSRAVHLPSSGKIEDITKLTNGRGTAEQYFPVAAFKAGANKSAEFFDGQSVVALVAARNNPTDGPADMYSYGSGTTLTLIDMLAANLRLIDDLANATTAKANNLAGSAAREPAFVAGISGISGKTTAATIDERALVGVSDIKATSEAQIGVNTNWVVVADNLSGDQEGSLTKEAWETYDRNVRRNIAEDILAVSKSTKSYTALLSGQIDEGSRFLGQKTPLDTSEDVDANITWYDSATQMTRINVGSDKNAHPGMRFEIWSRDEYGYYLRNGMLEVINVLGRNYSTARIIGEVSGRAIQASDDLINRIWEDGHYVTVGLLGRNWGGEYTRYSRSEIFTLLKNLGVPVSNVPNMNTKVIVMGDDPHADNTDGVNTYMTGIWLTELAKVQLREEVIRLYLDPR